jgi:DNA gyrase/topoisomerase IV subunit A
MLALVDGVPRTLRIDEFIRHYIEHQIEVIVRRTKYRLSEREKRAHILRGYLKALDALDAVIALIRGSANSDDAREGLMKLLEVDEIQANAILDMQLRRLAALERQKITDEYDSLMTEIKELEAILASPEKQREIIMSPKNTAMSAEPKSSLGILTSQSRISFLTKRSSSLSPIMAMQRGQRPTSIDRSDEGAKESVAPPYDKMM